VRPDASWRTRRCFDLAFSLTDLRVQNQLRECDHALDFAGAAEPARQTINAWVEDKTNRKIQDLIKPDTLTR